MAVLGPDMLVRRVGRWRNERSSRRLVVLSRRDLPRSASHLGSVWEGQLVYEAIVQHLMHLPVAPAQRATRRRSLLFPLAPRLPAPAVPRLCWRQCTRATLAQLPSSPASKPRLPPQRAASSSVRRPSARSSPRPPDPVLTRPPARSSASGTYALSSTRTPPDTDPRHPGRAPRRRASTLRLASSRQPPHLAPPLARPRPGSRALEHPSHYPLDHSSPHRRPPPPSSPCRTRPRPLHLLALPFRTPKSPTASRAFARTSRSPPSPTGPSSSVTTSASSSTPR